MLLSTLVPLVLFLPPWAVIKAFRNHVDVPGCHATCEEHHLKFDSYSSTKSGDRCACRAPENPGRWRVFDTSYYVFGGSSFGAAALDALIRGSAVVGLFLLELAVLLFALFRWSRRRLSKPR